MANQEDWIELSKLAENKINGVTAKEWHNRGHSMMVKEFLVNTSDIELTVRKDMSLVINSDVEFTVRRDMYEVVEYTNPDNKQYLYIFKKIL